MKRGKFYRHKCGALILAVSATRARLPANGRILISLRDWEVSGPWATCEVTKHWPQYDPAELAEWREKALALGARRYWEPLSSCEMRISLETEESDDERRAIETTE